MRFNRRGQGHNRWFYQFIKILSAVEEHSEREKRKLPRENLKCFKSGNVRQLTKLYQIEAQET